MQKKLALVAAVAGVLAAPAAFAEATLSGHLDIGLQRIDPGSGYAGSEWFLNDQQGSGGSYINFTGKDDLGGGLTGLAVVEVGFFADTGNFDNNVATGAPAGSTIQLAQRQVYAGLSGGFGTLTAGRQYRETFLVGAGGAYNYTASGIGVFFLNSYTGVRQSNFLKYTSPSLNGLNIAAGYGFGEGTTATTENDRYTEISAKYGAGPLRVGAALSTSKSSSVDTDVMVVGGQYSFGPTTVYAIYTTGETDGGVMDMSSYSLGVKQTIGNGDVVLQAGQLNDDITGSADSTLIGVAYFHRLSKQTLAYTSYGTVDNDANASLSAPRAAVATTAAGEDPNTFSVGVRVSF